MRSLIVIRWVASIATIMQVVRIPIISNSMSVSQSMMSLVWLLVNLFCRLLIIRMNTWWWLSWSRWDLSCSWLWMMILSCRWLWLGWTNIVGARLVQHFVCDVFTESTINSKTPWNGLFINITFNSCTFWRLTDSLFRVFECHHIHGYTLHVCQVKVIWAHSNHRLAWSVCLVAVSNILIRIH